MTVTLGALTSARPAAATNVARFPGRNPPGGVNRWPARCGRLVRGSGCVPVGPTEERGAAMARAATRSRRLRTQARLRRRRLAVRPLRRDFIDELRRTVRHRRGWLIG